MKTRLFTLMAVLVLVRAGGAMAASTYYVRTVGDDGASGLSPETAFRTIQHAVNSCRTSGCTIWVGPGVYPETIEIGTGAGRRARNGSPGAPNAILVDSTGGMTDDDPGSVIVDGENVRARGLYVRGRRHWTIRGLTFANQTSYNGQAIGASGLRVERCTFQVPRYYCWFQQRGTDFTFVDCVLDRNASSGHLLWITDVRGEIDVSRNDMAMNGGDLGSSGFGDGIPRGGYVRSIRYGVIVIPRSNGNVTIRIENNVISDLYLGLYAYANGQRHAATVSNNTAIECYYAFYGYGNRRSDVRVTDNVAQSCFYGVGGAASGRGTMTISGLLAADIGRSAVAAGRGIEIEGVIEEEDALLANPAGGDFMPLEDSPAIDAALALVRVGDDLLGGLRPTDGDGDGVAVADLGAVEFDASAVRSRPRLVRWQEDRPD